MPRPNNPHNPRTTINVKRMTRDKLNRMRIYPMEYLDLVIVRLIKEHEKVKE